MNRENFFEPAMIIVLHRVSLGGKPIFLSLPAVTASFWHYVAS
jgi:hypothetical protein